MSKNDINDDFWQSFFGGLSILFIAGFCDKTFFMNMIYVSVNSFWNAFLVSLTISELMNIVSLFLGEVIPLFVNRDALDWFAIVVFLIFGIAMFIEAQNMKPEILSNQLVKEENKDESKEKLVCVSGIKEEKVNKNELNVFNSWWKYCLAYVIGETGDKSQIATIVITSKYNFYGIFLGTSAANLFLVISSMVLGKSISSLLTNRQISLLGSFVFILFALIYLADKIFSFDYS